MHTYLLNVRVDDIGLNELIMRAQLFLSSKDAHMIVTLNPEILTAAHRDPHFADALNAASLNVADGFGLLYASILTGEPFIHRTTGTDLINILSSLAQKKGKRIFLLGGTNGLAKRTAFHLAKRFTGLQVRSSEGGQITRTSGRWDMNHGVLEQIRSYAPDILFVALGQKKQELWIRDHLPLLPSVKIAVGVGGAFAFFAGDLARAPVWMRAVGLEWAWRLLLEPCRLVRILRAIFLFPMLVIWDTLKKNET